MTTHHGQAGKTASLPVGVTARSGQPPRTPLCPPGAQLCDTAASRSITEPPAIAIVGCLAREPGKGERVRSLEGRGGEGVHGVSRTGLASVLERPPGARHHDDHDHGEDDQADEDHAPFLPVAPGYLAAVGG